MFMLPKRKLDVYPMTSFQFDFRQEKCCFYNKMGNIVGGGEGKTAPALFTLCLGSLLGLSAFYFFREKSIPKISILDTVGNTPLIYLPKLSKAAGANIFMKLQFMNPFGSSKDRAVKQFLDDAKAEDDEVVEASSGSTAISLVQMGHLAGKKVTLFLPNDLAEDKVPEVILQYLLLETLKANIVKVPPVSIVDSEHFYNLAQKYSEQHKAYFTNQFQNLSNMNVHYRTTGPQIYRQTNGLVDSFVCGAGTGGTLAGVSKFLKEKNCNIEVVLADPEGSGLFNQVKFGVLFTNQEKEGHRLKNPFDTVVQGVGLNRPTANFAQASIDNAFKITDEEVLHMSAYLIENEGLFLGGSSAMNAVCAVKQARRKPHSNIVTVAHDSGIRYLKKLFSSEYLRSKNIRFDKKENYDSDDLSFII